MQLVRTAIFTLSGVVSEATSAGLVALEGVRVDVLSMPCDEHVAGCVGLGAPIGIFKGATTDKNGRYSIPGLYPGKNNFIRVKTASKIRSRRITPRTPRAVKR